VGDPGDWIAYDLEIRFLRLIAGQGRNGLKGTGFMISRTQPGYVDYSHKHAVHGFPVDGDVWSWTRFGWGKSILLIWHFLAGASHRPEFKNRTGPNSTFYSALFGLVAHRFTCGIGYLYG
jgi:hypothetical protein